MASHLRLSFRIVVLYCVLGGLAINHSQKVHRTLTLPPIVYKNVILVLLKPLMIIKTFCFGVADKMTETRIYERSYSTRCISIN